MGIILLLATKTQPKDRRKRENQTKRGSIRTTHILPRRDGHVGPVPENWTRAGSEELELGARVRENLKVVEAVKGGCAIGELECGTRRGVPVGFGGFAVRGEVGGGEGEIAKGEWDEGCEGGGGEGEEEEEEGEGVHGLDIVVLIWSPLMGWWRLVQGRFGGWGQGVRIEGFMADIVCVYMSKIIFDQ